MPVKSKAKTTKKSVKAPSRRDLSLVPKVAPNPNKPEKESDRIERDGDGRLRIPPKSFAAMAKAFAASPNDEDGYGDMCAILLNQISSAMPFANGKSNDPLALNYAIESMLALGPKDFFESLVCSQMIACQAMGMEFLKRSLDRESTTEQVDANVNRATRLLRTFGSLAETLQARRGRGRQKIVVKHVNVNAGGQAIVGNVGRGVGGG